MGLSQLRFTSSETHCPSINYTSYQNTGSFDMDTYTSRSLLLRAVDLAMSATNEELFL